MAEEESKFLALVGIVAAAVVIGVLAVVAPIALVGIGVASVLGLAAFFVAKAILDRPSAPATKNVTDAKTVSAVPPSSAHQAGLTAQQSVNPQTIAQVAESRIKAVASADNTPTANNNSEEKESPKFGK